MQVKFDLKIGLNTYTLITEVADQMDFFRKMHFYSTLPQVGPNGETDLVLSYRVAQKQYEYFSIVSQAAGMEFKFGQYKDRAGELFSKGWEPLYQPEAQAEDAQYANGGLGQPTQALAPAPAATPAPTAAPAQARPVARTAAPAQRATAAPRPLAAAPAPTPAATPQVTQQVGNVLSKFGIV